MRCLSLDHSQARYWTMSRGTAFSIICIFWRFGHWHGGMIPNLEYFDGSMDLADIQLITCDNISRTVANQASVRMRFSQSEQPYL
jgi:hypothetical protein